MYSHGRHLPYAPSPHSYTPYTTLSATISLDEELKPPTHPAERDLHDSLAEIYSIIVTLDGLEKAFNKDSVTEAEYTEICSRLLKQYQSTLSDERVEREFGDLDTFKARWHVSIAPPAPLPRSPPHVRSPSLLQFIRPSPSRGRISDRP
jgi:ESCRT-I complex subunit VPS28